MTSLRILTSLLACAIAIPVVAETQLTGTVEVGTASRYVFRGIKRENSNLEAAVRLNHDQLYANLWTMQPYDSHSRREYNFAAGYQSKLEDAWLGRTVSYDVGAIFYEQPKRHYTPVGLRDSYEIYAGLTAPLAPNLSGSVYAYYDFRLKALTTEGSIGYAIPLGDLPASLNLSGFLGYTHAREFQPYGGYIGKDSYTYYGLSAEVPVRFDRFTVTAGAQYGDSLGLRGGKHYYDTTNALWWFAKVGYTF